MSDGAWGLGEVIAEIQRDQRIAALGASMQAEYFYRAIRTVDVAYRKALQDPETKIPTYMAATLFALIAMLPESETVEAKVEEAIRNRE